MSRVAKVPTVLLGVVFSVASPFARAQEPLAEPAAAEAGRPESTTDRLFDPETLPDWTSATTGSLGDEWLGPADGRRTLGRFGANLGRNFVGVFSRESIKPLLIGAVAAGIGSSQDEQIQASLGRSQQFEELGELGSNLGNEYWLAAATTGLFVAGRLSEDSRFRAATYDMGQAMIVTSVYTQAIKRVVGRRRPNGSDRLSFPSGHTSNAFAWATIANHHYGAKVGFTAYFVASFIGTARLEQGAHHLSDVLVGAAIGYVVGRTVVRENGEALKHRGPRLHIVPAFDARGGGTGVAVSVTF